MEKTRGIEGNWEKRRGRENRAFKNPHTGSRTVNHVRGGVCESYHSAPTELLRERSGRGDVPGGVKKALRSI